MKTLTHHLEAVRAKPPHIRKQVALTSAFVIASLIGVLWLGISLATDAYVVQGTSFADMQSGSVATTPSRSGLSGLLGAVGAAFDSAEPARVEVVNSGTDTSVNAPPPAKAPERTVIPF